MKGLGCDTGPFLPFPKVKKEEKLKINIHPVTKSGEGVPVPRDGNLSYHTFLSRTFSSHYFPFIPFGFLVLYCHIPSNIGSLSFSHLFSSSPLSLNFPSFPARLQLCASLRVPTGTSTLAYSTSAMMFAHGTSTQSGLCMQASNLSWTESFLVLVLFWECRSMVPALAEGQIAYRGLEE